MKAAAAIFRMSVRLTGLASIILGGLLWTGHAMTLIPVHMLLGFALVLSLWALAALAAQTGAAPGLAMLTFVWGVAVTVLGMSQDRLLIGDFHWGTKMLHLIGGLVAMGQAEWLAGRIMQARAPVLQR